MKLTLTIADIRYRVLLPGQPVSIPLQFNGPQPNTYGVPRAVSAAYEGDGWVGDTRRGGSCNFETYAFIPHCNGTHTEGIGHISKERIGIDNELSQALIPAVIVSIPPEAAHTCGETYDPDFTTVDQVITRHALEDALALVPHAFSQALLIRTTPNSLEKCLADYTQTSPAFFTREAMIYLVQRGVRHLLVDIPSLDRMHDEGKLTAHHIWFGMPAGSHDPGDPTRRGTTITEMIFIPDTVPDGICLLNLQIAPFVSDAAPSRPWIFSLTPC